MFRRISRTTIGRVPAAGPLAAGIGQWPLRAVAGSVLAAFGGCLLVFVWATTSFGTDRRDTVAPPRASSFTITKTEGPQSDEVQVVYTKPGCFLTGVNTCVMIRYASGERPMIETFWPRWLSHQQKSYLNDECRADLNADRIQEVGLCGTAKEHSLVNGQERVKRITFALYQQFDQSPVPPVAAP